MRSVRQFEIDSVKNVHNVPDHIQNPRLKTSQINLASTSNKKPFIPPPRALVSHFLLLLELKPSRNNHAEAATSHDHLHLCKSIVFRTNFLYLPQGSNLQK